MFEFVYFTQHFLNKTENTKKEKKLNQAKHYMWTDWFSYDLQMVVY